MVQSGSTGGMGDQSRSPTTFAHKDGLIAVELVLGDQIIDDGDNLVRGNIKDRPCRVLDRLANHFRQRCDRAPGGFGLAVRVQARFGVAENVGGTGVRDGVAVTVCAPYSYIVRGIVSFRLEQLDRRLVDVLRLGKSRVGEAGDVGAAGADID